MSFSYKIIKNKIKKRKALQADVNTFTPMNVVVKNAKKRMSVFIFMEERGSVTIETAIVLPLFIFAMLSLIYILEILHIYSVLAYSICETSREISSKGYLYYAGEKGKREDPVSESLDKMVSITYVKEKITETAGKEFLNRTIIKNGAAGISCLYSDLLNQEEVVDLVIVYEIQMPFRIVGIPDIKILQRSRMKSWSGYCLNENEKKQGEVEQMVYVAASGTVYHLSKNCTHLDLSIKTASLQKAEQIRNLNGEKYSECELCKEDKQQTDEIYLTDYGNRYHYSGNCSGLKRDISKIPITRIGNRSLCERCGGH